MESVRRFQNVARRLLSLPGFSTLVECDTYLPRYYQFLVGQPSKMCFSSEVGFLCPKNVLKTISSLQWLGFPWNPELKLSFSRNHQFTPNCDHPQPLIHLGGRRFLSTTSDSVLTTEGHLNISPLAVYSFPCNTSFVGMKTTLAPCPESLSISLPLFSSSSITYVHWDPVSDDVSPLQLHHKSLSVPPSLIINGNVNDLDELYQFYGSQLSSALEQAETMIDEIEVTSETTITEYVAFVACALSVIDFVLFCVACKCVVLRAVNRRFGELSKQPLPVPSCSTKICKQCSKPVRRRQLKDQRQVPEQVKDLQNTKQ